MSLLYTHIWQHKDKHFACEGSCSTSYQEALQRLKDYHDRWQANHFQYRGTYVEDQNQSVIYKIDLSNDICNSISS